MSKPAIQVVSQGKTIIEADEVGFLIMFPDGEVVGASTKAKAKSKARRWFRANLGTGLKIGVGEIEWR